MVSADVPTIVSHPLCQRSTSFVIPYHIDYMEIAKSSPNNGAVFLSTYTVS